MKKILHICNHDFYLKKFLKPIVLKLDDENYEVHVACKVNNEDLSMFKRIKIHDISYPQSILSFYKLFLSFRQCFSIIKNNNYDIVISHNRIASFVGRVSCFLSGNKNNIYFAHGFYFHDNQNYLSYFFSIQLERILSKITKHTLSQSLEDTKLMIKKKYIHKSNITHVGNGIDTNKFRRLKNKIDIRNELGIPNDAFVICGIGRLVKGKGFQDMVEAFKLINKKSKNVYLIIVGGNVVQDISKYQSDIMHKIKEYKLQKKIKMTGMVDNVEEYLGCSDLFISASYREGISRVMLEAMCMGMPIIATRIRGSREVVKNNINGFLFTPGNVSELVEKIIYLIGSSNQKLKELSDNAYDTIHPYYTEKSYTQRQLDIIKKMEN